MHEHSSRTPQTPTDVKRYISDLLRTDAHLRARSLERAKAPIYGGKRLAHHAIQDVMSRTVTELDGREIERFDPAYNELIRTLPLLRGGLEGLHRHHGNSETNLTNVIEFNHAMRDYINERPSIERAAFRTMIGSTMNALQYEPELIETVQWDIFPGMENEIVGEEGLYYVPGNFLVLESGERPEDLARPDVPIDKVRRAYAEMHGIDNAIINLDTDDMVTIDFKKSKQAAIETQRDHEHWLARHHLGPDNHLVIWPGYSEDDFVPGKIGRVKPEARLREQPRIDGLVLGKFEEIKERKALLTK